MEDYKYEYAEKMFNEFLDDYENYEIAGSLEEKQKYLESAEYHLRISKNEYRQFNSPKAMEKAAICKGKLIEVQQLLSELQSSQEKERNLLRTTEYYNNLIKWFDHQSSEHPSTLKECDSLCDDLISLQSSFKELNGFRDADMYAEKCAVRISHIRQTAHSIRNDLEAKNKLAWRSVLAFGVIYLIISAFVNSVISLIVVIIIVGMIGAITLYIQVIDKICQNEGLCGWILALEVYIVSIITAFGKVSVIAGIGVIIAPVLLYMLLSVILKSN